MLQVYEFHGCMYHGCIACYPNRHNKLPKSSMTADEAYVKTREREDSLKAAGPLFALGCFPDDFCYFLYVFQATVFARSGSAS